jgi:hypothetical protein
MTKAISYPSMINLSESASNAMLEALTTMMDGGSIVLQTDDGAALAVLRLSSPAAIVDAEGELEFNDIANEDAALGQGNATNARILSADGSEVFSCDVGDRNSDAVIKLNTTKIYHGDPVRLSSFRLVMP